MKKGSSRHERKLSRIFSAIRGLQAAVPVGGVIAYGTVRMRIDVRDQLIADLNTEADALIEQEMKANPDVYYQWPDGDWSLREQLGPKLVK